MKGAVLTAMFILLGAACAFAQFGGGAGQGPGSQQFGYPGQPPFGSAGRVPFGGVEPPFSSQPSQPGFNDPFGSQRYGAPGYNMGRPYGGSPELYGDLGQPYRGYGDLDGSRRGLEELDRPGTGIYSWDRGRGYSDGDFGSSRSWQLPGSVPGTGPHGDFGQRDGFGLGSRGLPGTGFGPDTYGGSGVGSGQSGSVFGPGGSAGGMSSGGFSGGPGG